METRDSWWVILLSWNQREDTERCLKALQREAPEAHPVVADNGSEDDTVAMVKTQFPDVPLIENGANLGFSRGHNVGVEYALAHGADWVVLLNTDAFVEPGAIAALRGAAERHPGAGILAGKLLFADWPDRIWWAGQRVSRFLGWTRRPHGYWAEDSDAFRKEEPTDRAVGAFMAVSRDAIEKVGMLDDDLFFLVEDVEWSLRVRRGGFEIWFVPDAVALHRVQGATRGREASATSIYYAVRNWLIVGDRHLPVPRLLSRLRGVLIAAVFAVHALRTGHRSEALMAVRDGYLDWRRGRVGPRPRGA